MNVPDKTIFRVVKNKDNPYVMMDKRPLENKELSWKAKGVLAYLLSRPDDWEIIFAQLEKQATDGRDGLRSALKELMDAGHLFYTKSQGEDGRFTGGEWQVYEVPVTEIPSSVEPHTEKPDSGKPDSGKSATTKKESTKKDKTKGEDVSDFSRDLEKARKRTEEQRRQREKRGVGGYVLRYTSGIKKAARLEEIFQELKDKLNLNLNYNHWEDFVRYVDTMEREEGWQLARFLDWLFKKDGFSTEFWPAKKMLTHYPEAFTVNLHNIDPEPVIVDPDGFAEVDL